MSRPRVCGKLVGAAVLAATVLMAAGAGATLTAYDDRVSFEDTTGLGATVITTGFNRFHLDAGILGAALDAGPVPRVIRGITGYGANDPIDAELFGGLAGEDENLDAKPYLLGDGDRVSGTGEGLGTLGRFFEPPPAFSGIVGTISENFGEIDVIGGVGVFGLSDLGIAVAASTTPPPAPESSGLPEPVALALIGLGLAGIGLLWRRRTA